jgi:hypothetical protein
MTYEIAMDPLILLMIQNAVLYESWFDERARQRKVQLETAREARKDACVNLFTGSGKHFHS